MIRKSIRIMLMIIILSTAGCVKDTYDMNMLSKQMHLSPTMAISAIKGDVSLSDMVKSNDTLVFDQNNFVKLVFKKDSVIDLKLTDFLPVKNMVDLNGNGKVQHDIRLFDTVKGLVQMSAAIDTQSLNLEIEDILSHVSGDILISNPSIKLIYSNSFAYPVQIALNASGRRKAKTIDLNLAPFNLNYPFAPETEVSDTFIIDKSNSALSLLMSLPPEEINFSGNAVISITVKKSPQESYLLASNRLIGSLEVEIPMEFRMNNLQFTDTVDNFMKDEIGNSNSPVKPENFKLLRIDFLAKNGFPLGVSLKMSLYDSLTHTIKSTVDATNLLEPAPVDSNGKVTGVTETGTSIEFTSEFFSSINKADKIIFQFTLHTTDGGSKDVKIYSDYRIDFNASLVMKPDINLK